MSDWASLKDRVGGKWQLPLLGLSLVLMGGAVLRLRSNPDHLPLDSAVKHLETLVAGGFYGRAIRFGHQLLGRQEYTDADRAPVHLSLARARYKEALGKRIRTPDAGRQINEHYSHATSQGLSLTANDQENMGWALEWQGRISKSLDRFDLALQRRVKHSLDLRKHIISLTRSYPDASDNQVEQMLGEFLADLGERRLDLRLWAIELKLDLMEDLGRADEGMTLLARNRERFKDSDLGDRFRYLEAWLLHKAGHFDDAETHLRTLLHDVSQLDEVYAMAGWLLGRVVSSDGGPQRPLEGMSFFTDVISHHPGSPYGVASRIGLAEALAMLERHGEAVDAYLIAVEELRVLDDSGPVDRAALRTSLGVMADLQRQAGRLADAVAYSRLAVALIDRDDVERATLFLHQLAQLQFRLARQLDEDSDKREDVAGGAIEAADAEARVAYGAAADTYLDLTHINALNDQLATDASWKAAELSALAGRRERATALFGAFTVERPEDPLVPRALFRIGQLEQLSGKLPEAIESYKECYRRFPRTLDGARALIPLAQCYLGMGPDYEDLAEKAFRIVLEESEVFTPQAPEFAEALFLLGNALNRRGDFERAIATLEEALERYPSDSHVWQARFLLADSYRRSGLVVKEEISKSGFAGEIEQLSAESTARFEAAVELYRELIEAEAFEDPSQLNRLHKVYLRHSYLYEADCYFEMRDFRRALKLYEEAAGMYKDSRSALAAHVQIINSHVFLGEPEEARAALARAVVLVEGLPDEAFGNSVSPETRKDWKRYFDWLDASELF